MIRYFRTCFSFLQSINKLEDIFKFCVSNNIKYPVIADDNGGYSFAKAIHLSKKYNLNIIFGVEVNLESINLIVAKNYKGYQKLLKIISIISNKTTDKNIMSEKINYIIDDNLFIFKNNIQKIDYLKEDDFKLYQVVNSIRLQKQISLEDIDYSENKYFYNINIKDENEKYFSKISYNFPKIKNNFASLHPKDVDVDKELVKLSHTGLKARLFSKNVDFEKYQKRLNHELSIIKSKGFSDYFMVVHDYVKFARSNGIYVGPGRGSAAGSLVAYVLGITNVDPLEYNLFFERFLNPKRINYPDIDIDFEDKRRQEVVDYIFEKYSSKNVCHIVTFQTLGAKMAIRDIGRVLGIEISLINELSKLIPLAFNNDIKEALKHSLKLQYKYQNNITAKLILDLANKCIGLPRQQSIHAAGIVISKTHLENIIPISTTKEGYTISQFDMDHLEEWGLLKMDILGLRNLTILKNIVKSIYKNKGKPIDLDEISYDDNNIFSLLSSGYNLGIFQLESPGMIRTFQKIKPNSLEDIATIISLYRPGPKDQINLFAELKNSEKKIEYLDKGLIPILQKTFGIIVYQEQIMEISLKFFNFTMSEADILRRAVSKKDNSLITNLRNRAKEGAIKLGHSINLFDKIYDLIYKFGNYGFNKSHAISYAKIAYQLAYLKYYYPIDFFSSLLTSVIGNEEKTKEYFVEADRLGIKFFEFDLNKIFPTYKNGDNGIVPSMMIIKSLGPSSLAALKNSSNKDPFIINDPIKTITRLLNLVSKKIVIYLIVLCNISSEKFNKTSLIKSIDDFENYKNLILLKNKELDFSIAPIFPSIKMHTENYKLLSDIEKKSLGFNYFYDYLKLMKSFLNNKNSLDKLVNSELESGIIVVKINNLKIKKTKISNEEMAFLEISDNTLNSKATIFPLDFKLLQKELLNNKILPLKLFKESNFNKKIPKFIIKK